MVPENTSDRLRPTLMSRGRDLKQKLELGSVFDLILKSQLGIYDQQVRIDLVWS